MPERPLAQKIYSRIMRLYPRDFRSRFGGEMEQNFLDICSEREVRYEFGWLRVAWLFGDAIFQAGRENLSKLRREGFMKILDPSPRAALTVAAFLALPMAIILPTAILNIAPLNSYFQAQMQDTTGSGHAIGVLSLAASMVTLPLGGIVALTPVVKATRSGAGVLEHRSNLILGAILLIVGIGVWFMLLLDSASCVMGMKACD